MLLEPFSARRVLWPLLAVGLAIFPGCAGAPPAPDHPADIFSPQALARLRQEVRLDIPGSASFAPSPFQSATALTRTSGGGFRIPAGAYDLDGRLCWIEPGRPVADAHADYRLLPWPASGSGLFRKLVQNAEPPVPADVRRCLGWAVLARAHPDELPATWREAARRAWTARDWTMLAQAAAPDPSEPDTARSGSAVSSGPDTAARVRLRELCRQGVTDPDRYLEVVLPEQASFPRRDASAAAQPWSLHPQGYFIRCLPLDADLAHIQLFLPGAFSYTWDDKGRLVGLEDAVGNAVSVEYDDRMPPLRLVGEPACEGRTLRSLMLTRTVSPVADFALRLTHRFPQGTWTFTGTPRRTEAGYVATSERYPEAETLYRSAQTLGRHLAVLAERHPRSLEDTLRLQNLGMLAQAVRRAAGRDPDAPAGGVDGPRARRGAGGTTRSSGGVPRVSLRPR